MVLFESAPANGLMGEKNPAERARGHIALPASSRAPWVVKTTQMDPEGAQKGSTTLKERGRGTLTGGRRRESFLNPTRDLKNTDCCGWQFHTEHPTNQPAMPSKQTVLTEKWTHLFLTIKQCNGCYTERKCSFSLTMLELPFFRKQLLKRATCPEIRL